MTGYQPAGVGRNRPFIVAIAGPKWPIFMGTQALSATIAAPPILTRLVSVLVSVWRGGFWA
jgi:hypothetical protein